MTFPSSWRYRTNNCPAGQEIPSLIQTPKFHCRNIDTESYAEPIDSVHVSYSIYVITILILFYHLQSSIPRYFFLKGENVYFLMYIIQDIPGEISIFWEVIVSVILSKKSICTCVLFRTVSEILFFILKK
jgi:hypothetical protein